MHNIYLTWVYITFTYKYILHQDLKQTKNILS